MRFLIPMNRHQNWTRPDYRWVTDGENGEKVRAVPTSSPQ